MTSCCSMTAQKYWLIISCTITLLLALLIGLVWPTISIKYFLYPQLELKNGSLNYDNWKETPIPMYLEVYFWNWTNPEEINNYKKVKPIFKELGPYVFLEKHIRTNITWSANGTTVDFFQKRIWHFDPKLSNGSLSDEILNINPIAAACGYTSRDLDTLLKSMINIMMGLGRGPLFIKRNVSELLFDGYTDPLLRVIQANGNPAFPKPPFEKMGWFVERNNSETYDGKFRMFTGVDDIFKLGNLELWNGKPGTNYYRGNCGEVKGTTGELWPPVQENEKPNLSLFVSDICRTIELKYSRKYSKLGIDGYKWIADESVFDNGKKYPEMACYCNAAPESCPDLASGVFNASKCKWDSPAFISFPHFYLADQIYRNDKIGMKPKKDLHEFSMAIEPHTGIPLSIKAALQINLFIRPYLGISEFRDVPTMMVPMFWFRQRAELTPELADQARIAINLPSFGVWFAYGLLGVGVLLAISTVFCFVFRFNRAADVDGMDQPIIQDEREAEST